MITRVPLILGFAKTMAKNRKIFWPLPVNRIGSTAARRKVVAMKSKSINGSALVCEVLFFGRGAGFMICIFFGIINTKRSNFFLDRMLWN